MRRLLRVAPNNTRVTEERMPPELVRGVLQRAAALVTWRLHPSLFAIQVGCPVVSISTENKTRGIFSMLQLEDCLFDYSRCDPARLYARVHEAMGQGGVFKQARERAAQLGSNGRQRLVEFLKLAAAGGSH